MGEKSIVLSGVFFFLFFDSLFGYSFIYFVFNSLLCHLFLSSQSICRFFVAWDVLQVVRRFHKVSALAAQKNVLRRNKDLFYYKISKASVQSVCIFCTLNLIMYIETSRSLLFKH